MCRLCSARKVLLFFTSAVCHTQYFFKFNPCQQHPLISISTLPSHKGLRYEDLLNEDEKEVKEALELADPAIQTARTRRIKRAIDLSYKKKSLQDYAPDMDLELFKKEIYVDVEKIRARDQEYAQLNAHNKM